MTAVPGRWALTISTPVGRIHADMVFTDAEGRLSGTAVGTDEAVPLRDVTAGPAPDGAERVTWRQSVTKPIRLDLDFDVVVRGDQMHGHSRAGRLPRSTVIGHREGGGESGPA